MKGAFMAEELDESGEALVVEKKPSRIKQLLLILIIILVAIFAMIFIANMVFKSRSSEMASVTQELWAPTVTPKSKAYSTFPLETLQLNLNDPTGSITVFIKVTIALAYEGDSGDKEEKKQSPFQKELEDRKFQIKDKIIQLIESKSYDEINSPDKQRALKKEIMSQINSILMNGIIRDVYFSEFNVILSK
jgi:flagellar FliL protein